MKPNLPSGNGGKYSEDDVAAITNRAAKLLDELRNVLAEMADRLEALNEGESP